MHLFLGRRQGTEPSSQILFAPVQTGTGREMVGEPILGPTEPPADTPASLLAELLCKLAYSPDASGSSQATGGEDFPMVSLKVYALANPKRKTIDLTSWLDSVLDALTKGGDWNTYYHVSTNLPSQLANVALFINHTAQLEKLHDLITDQLERNKFPEPPATSGLKKGDVAFILYHTLIVLIAYSEWFRPQKKTETVRAFMIGIGKWEGTAKCCIHALALCCHELPKAVDKGLYSILTDMHKIISRSNLAMDILEFLARLSRLPLAYQSIEKETLRKIFGICCRHLTLSREKRQDMANSANTKSSNRLSNQSGGTVTSATSQSTTDKTELPEYVYALAYHVITHWFLAMPVADRPTHVGWIAKNLLWKDEKGNDVLDEPSQVILDMMHRTAYLDLGETIKPGSSLRPEENMLKQMWLVGLSIVTEETNTVTGWTRITKRQASGTTCASYQPLTAPLPSHHVQVHNRSTHGHAGPPTMIYPQHVFLSQNSTISPVAIPMQAIVLPEDEQTKRAISTFDRIDTVDGHKAGVIYVAAGQKEEREILANTAGSEVFEDFLAGLGTKVTLKGATFNTQGLDRQEDMDGTHTYAWRDRVTEIVFHVPTMMPTNLQHDGQCTNKKRHTGNDFVNIIFNESGSLYRFETIDSEFNYVNIVVTPPIVITPDSRRPLSSSSESGGTETKHFFDVRVLCRSSFPKISSATTPTIVSASALPGYIRQLAINASVFSLVWSNRGGGEHISNWRSRLREIYRLRERYSNTGNTASVGYPEMGTAEDRGGAKSYKEGDKWEGTLANGGMVEAGQHLLSIDFTRWT
ncbi:MAG: hypothetical protein Q9218_001554 [Villophora microphyllina]